MTAGHPGPTASERLLAKTLAKGRTLRRRRKILQRAAVLGFVTAVAAGGAAGAAVSAGGRSAPSPATGGTGTSPIRGTVHPRPGYREVFPLQVTASASLSGHPATGAVDDDLRTFWGVGSKRGALPGVGQSLTLHFARPQRIAAVAFFDGDQQPQQDFTSTYRPMRVEVIFSSGPPLVYELRSAMLLQAFEFRPRSTTSVEILVTGVYPPSTGSARDPLHRICALAEVYAYVPVPGT